MKFMLKERRLGFQYNISSFRSPKSKLIVIKEKRYLKVFSKTKL